MRFNTQLRHSIPAPAWRSLVPLLILLAIFMLTFGVAYWPGLPVWDAAFYYAYTRSTVLDGDLQLDNDFQLLYAHLPDDSPFVKRRVERERTPTGHVKSTFPIGASVLWLPWMALAHGLYHVTQTLPPSGYEPLYVWTTGVAASALGWLAMAMASVLARRLAAPRRALLATVTVWLASPLLYYQFREVFYSHAASALVTALVLFVWWPANDCDDGSLGQAAALGAMIGLAMLVRWQHAIYLILPLGTTYKTMRYAGRRGRARSALYLTVAGMAALICFSPQLAHWRELYGSWLTLPQGSEYMEWQMGFWRPVLFSPFRGLLFWMPVFFFSVAGLFKIARRNLTVGLPLLLILGLSFYVNASVRDWFGGGGYGPRRWSSELPILVMGLAGFVEVWPARLRAIGSGLLSGGLIVHQWVLLRFGLADRIGGRVVSMYPKYQWHETRGLEFIRQWIAYLPRLISDPWQSLVWPGSPLDSIVQGRPETFLYLGIAAGSIGSVILSAALGVWGWRRLKPPARYWLLGAILMCGSLGLSAWLLSQ